MTIAKEAGSCNVYTHNFVYNIITSDWWLLYLRVLTGYVMYNIIGNSSGTFY